MERPVGEPLRSLAFTEVEVFNNEHGSWVGFNELVADLARHRFDGAGELGFQLVEPGRVVFEALALTVRPHGSDLGVQGVELRLQASAEKLPVRSGGHDVKSYVNADPWGVLSGLRHFPLLVLDDLKAPSALLRLSRKNPF